MSIVEKVIDKIRSFFSFDPGVSDQKEAGSVESRIRVAKEKLKKEMKKYG